MTVFGLTSLVMHIAAFANHRINNPVGQHHQYHHACNSTTKNENRLLRCVHNPHALSLMKNFSGYYAREVYPCRLSQWTGESEYLLCFISSKHNELIRNCNIRMSNSIGKQFNVERCGFPSKYEWEQRRYLVR